MGNPRYHTTFCDELNHIIANLGRAANRLVWAERVFAYFAENEKNI